jgi:dienelactone hydrolase
MIQSLFHTWERRLAAAATDRVVRPFEWGLDWIPSDAAAAAFAPAARLQHWVSKAMADSDVFYALEPTRAYQLGPPDARGERLLTFPTAFDTPHIENNTVYGRLVPARQQNNGRRRAAVVVLPQWNSDEGGHLGLCRLLALHGLSALRLSLPYHDRRMPPELRRADYIVSANVARTVQVCRQAVLDTRRAVAWLAGEGFERIGILGTSLGSCLALLTAAHEPIIRAQALNHVSPLFADVVWRGLSTEHVRKGLEGHIELETLRDLWKPISPRWFLDRLHDRRTLLVYARYDLTFPVDLSQELVSDFRDRRIPHEVRVLPCGHYSSGKTPFKFLDGFLLARFLRRALIHET